MALAMQKLVTNKTAIQKRFRPLVAKLLAARAVAEVIRPKINAQHAEILAAGDYRDHNGERITEPKWAWTIQDEDVAAAFYAECDKANAAAGYKNLPAGRCPALTAEHEALKVEWAMIALAVELIDPVLENANGENRTKLLDLLCGMALAK